MLSPVTQMSSAPADIFTATTVFPRVEGGGLSGSAKTFFDLAAKMCPPAARSPFGAWYRFPEQGVVKNQPPDFGKLVSHLSVTDRCET